MKILDEYNINKLSKILYKTNVMPTGNSQSFIELSKKLILAYHKGYDLNKVKRVLSSELIVNYGLTVNDDEVEAITTIVDTWYSK